MRETIRDFTALSFSDILPYLASDREQFGSPKFSNVSVCACHALRPRQGMIVARGMKPDKLLNQAGLALDGFE